MILDDSQLSPALIKKIKKLIIVYYPQVLKNEISLRDFWEVEGKGNLIEILSALFINNKSYKLDDKEVDLIHVLLIRVPSKLDQIKNFPNLLSKAETEAEIRDLFARFIKTFSKLLRITKEDSHVLNDHPIISSEDSQLSPALIKKIPTFKKLIIVYYPQVLKNEISLREFWEVEGKGNLNNLLYDLFLNNDSYKLDDKEVDLINVLLIRVPSKLDQIKNFPNLLSKAETEAEIRDLFARFIKTFSKLLRITKEDNYNSSDPKFRSGDNSVSNDKNIIMEKLFKFSESVCELRQGIDHLFDASNANESHEIVINLMSQYVTPSLKFKKDYQTLIEGIRNNLPKTISNKIGETDQKLSFQIDKLIEYFSNSSVNISDIEDTMNYIERKVLWEVLWRLMLQNRIESN